MRCGNGLGLGLWFCVVVVVFDCVIGGLTKAVGGDCVAFGQVGLW